VVAGQIVWVIYATRMRDHFNFFLDRLAIIHHADGFISWIEAALQTFIVGRDTCRAGVFVTFQRLDAAQRKHKTTRRIDEIRTDAKSPSRIGGRDKFPAGNQGYTLTQAFFAQQVIDKR